MKLFIRNFLFLFLVGIISQNVFAEGINTDNDKDLKGMPKKGLVATVVKGTASRPEAIAITDVSKNVVYAGTGFTYKGGEITMHLVSPITTNEGKNLTLKDFKNVIENKQTAFSTKWISFGYFRDKNDIDITGPVSSKTKAHWTVSYYKDAIGNVVETSSYTEVSKNGEEKSIYFSESGSIVSLVIKGKEETGKPLFETRKSYDPNNGVLISTVETEERRTVAVDPKTKNKTATETTTSTLYKNSMGGKIQLATLVTVNGEITEYAVYDANKNQLFSAKPIKSEGVAEDGYQKFFVEAKTKSFGINTTPWGMGTQVEAPKGMVGFNMELDNKISNGSVDIKKLYSAFKQYAVAVLTQQQYGQTKDENNAKVNLNRSPRVYKEETNVYSESKSKDYVTFIKVPNGYMERDLKLSLHNIEGNRYFGTLSSAPFSSDNFLRPLLEIELDNTGVYSLSLGNNYSINIVYSPETYEIEIDPANTSFTYTYKQTVKDVKGKKSLETTTINFNRDGVRTDQTIKSGNVTTTTYYDGRGNVEKTIAAHELKAEPKDITTTSLKTSEGKINATYITTTNDKKASPSWFAYFDPATQNVLFEAKWIRDTEIGTTEDAYYTLTPEDRGKKAINVVIPKANLLNGLEAAVEAFDIYTKGYVLDDGYMTKDGDKIKIQAPDDPTGRNLKIMLYTKDNKKKAVMVIKDSQIETLLVFDPTNEMSLYAANKIHASKEAAYNIITYGNNDWSEDFNLSLSEVRGANAFDILRALETFKEPFDHAAAANKKPINKEKKKEAPRENALARDAKVLIVSGDEKAKLGPDHYNDAIRDYNEADDLLLGVGERKYTPLRAETHYKTGNLRYLTGNYHAAVNSFTLALAAMDSHLHTFKLDAESNLLMGKIYFYLGVAYAKYAAQLTETRPEGNGKALYRSANECLFNAKQLYNYDIVDEWDASKLEILYNRIPNIELSTLNNDDTNELLYMDGLNALLKSKEYGNYAAEVLVPALMKKLNVEQDADGVHSRMERLQDIAANNPRSTSSELAEINEMDKTNSGKILDKMENVKVEISGNEYDKYLNEFLKALFNDGEFYLKAFKSLSEDVNSDNQENMPKLTAAKFTTLLALSIVLNYFVTKEPEKIKDILPVQGSDADKLMAEIAYQTALFGGDIYAKARNFEKVAANKGIEFKLDKSRSTAENYAKDIKSSDIRNGRR